MKSNIPYTKYCVFEGDSVGGKAAQLIKIKESDINVPHFIVIPAEYYDSVLNKSLNESHSERMDDFEFPKEDIEKINSKFNSSIQYFSVRSSAMGEDGNTFSYAGQFESFLYVSRDDLSNKIKEVWKSAFSKRINFYREQNKIKARLRMAVIIQEMVPSDISGVMFGINPISLKKDEMLISAVYGLGEGLVSGALNSDNYFIKGEQLIHSEITEKTQKIIKNPRGIGTAICDVEESKISTAALDQQKIKSLLAVLIKLNKLYDFPQDVEWAYHNEELFILQTRPITNAKHKEGTKIIWDNSNIIESYPGVTSPLTFSFIKKMYRVVYIQFSQLLGIDQKLLKANEEVYANMLGHLRGRVYYNLRSWYRALALLPGYKLNARFMETMMGVKEKFELEDQFKGSKAGARLRIVSTIFKMIWTFIVLPRKRNSFICFLDTTIAEYKKIDFQNSSSEELMEHYKTFEKILTEKWEPPLVNDFFAMIYFGVFQKLITKWIGSDHPQLHNDLLAFSNDIISTQPMIKSLEIAKEILNSESDKKIFDQTADKVWEDLLNGNAPQIFAQINSYLNLYGERCLGELKLETISYNQDPEKFIKILQSYVKNPNSLLALDKSQSNKIRDEANALVQRKLEGKFVKSWVFKYFTRKTRELVSNRENLRFERTRGFGIVREIFSSMGKQFESKNIIDNHRDIFYLTIEEIFDFIKGTSVLSELKSTIELRKKKYDEFENDVYVPERITTYGIVNEGLIFKKEPNSILDGEIKGTACCPGIIKSEVCIVTSPDQISDLNGKIMVTSSTDPGWVSLFPTCSGILVERGSLLSHSAIVARELGIPCIVAIDGLMQKLKTGDFVEMDGSTGIVNILENEH